MKVIAFSAKITPSHLQERLTPLLQITQTYNSLLGRKTDQGEILANFPVA